MQNNWVYDYETLSNCFIAVFQHYKDEDQRKVFVIWNDRNDLDDMVAFLNNSIQDKEWHISYNGLAFDAQITHHILDNYRLLKTLTAEQVAGKLYAYAQLVINRSDAREFQDYPPNRMKIRQIDLFKMNHWDNPAKSSSLKWLQYSMDWINVEEMPIHHTATITTQEEVEMITSYCINDVRSTARVLLLSKEQLTLRQNLTKDYGIDLYNASEPRISKELFSYFLCKKLNMDKRTLKNLRTPRTHIALSEIILPYIKFKTPEFNKVLEYFKSQVITNTKGSLNYSMIYKGVKTDYGLGGIHGARSAEVYEASAGWTIMTSDVTSFYPNLAIRNGFSPEHLPAKEFLDQYEWFFDERKVIPKSDPRNYVYKIILNSTYGLSNDENSFLYDPRFTMQITINGQLSLSMLYEMLAENIPGAVPLMQNTDGLEMMIPSSYKDKYLEICAQWEKITNLQLEHDEYQKLILADVNNYIAVYKNGKTKCKGRFEWEDLEKKKIASLHKNKSFLVIPKAIYQYFVNGVKPEHYLESNKNIFDYCGGAKAKGNWRFVKMEIVDGSLENTQLHKIIRYYISKQGCKIIKRHAGDGREIQLESGRWMQKVVNDLSKRTDKSWEDLNIDTEYYLQEIYKEINNIDKKVTRNFTQLTMF
jgi:hypothetical protein